MNESATISRPRLSSTLVLWLVIAAGAAILLGLVALRGSERRNSAEKSIGVGERLVGWRLAPLTGADAPLSSEETAGQVVLLNLWGPWCSYCRLELPHLVELQQKLADRKDFRLVSVSCSPERDDLLDPIRSSTEKYLAAKHWDFATYGDPSGSFRKQLMLTVATNGYPITVLLDRQGVVRAVWSGYAPGDEAEIERLVNKQLAVAPKTG